MFTPAALANNAMLHKDLTQWLRNKTFSVLFFGLIFLAEALSLFFGLLPMDKGEGGPVAFGFMTGILYVYAFIIAFSGYGLTAKEFQNRTFELYELSGMSLEKMIRGKLMSMLAQFLFGFFCVTPFMFFAYLLGGLDFYQIVATALTLALLVTPLYLLALAVSLHNKQFRGGGALIRLFAVLFGIYTLPSLLFRTLYYGGARSSIGGPSELLQKLSQLDPDALIFAAVFLAFYAQICLLLFYLSCNAVAPPTDTREPQVKMLATTLSLCLMWIAAWPMVKSGSGNNVGSLLGAFMLMGVMGVVYFWSPLEPPLMARKRQESARWAATRWFHYWFQAGPWGTFRVVLLYWLASWAVLAVGSTVHSYRTRHDEFFRIIALPLALPFFIAVPACFITRFRSLRTRALSQAMRTIIILYWVIAGVGLMVTTLVIRESYRNLYVTAGEVLTFLSLIASPISAMISLNFRDSAVLENAPMIFITLGAVGVPLMMRTIRGRALAARAPLPAALPRAAKPEPMDAPRLAPPPLPQKVTAQADAQTMEAAE